MIDELNIEKVNSWEELIKSLHAMQNKDSMDLIYLEGQFARFFIFCIMSS
jgi:hypothetical protein